MTICHTHGIRCLLVIAALWCGPSSWAQDRVSETAHNLSASGTGRIRGHSEGQVCLFCHTPHNASGTPPLWNRGSSRSSYRIYQSSTLDAKPGQPTGSSKLCLSCHDGTIALGSVLSRGERIRMAGGEFMPAGLTNLGTDLSDDHPVSFHYTSGLAAADRQLADPRGLPPEIQLDEAGRLQCTACHNPHKDPHGKFLVMRAEFGALCTACHVMNGWRVSTHQSSSAVVSGSRLGDWPYRTVAENACRSCHRPHTAGGRERLLLLENEEDNCLNCHDGLVARANIRAELDKPSAHNPRRYFGVHNAGERTTRGRAHVECCDCHNPHAVTPESASAAYVPIGATLARTPGVSSTGTHVEEARNEYEVCFRCHGDSAVDVPRRVMRQAQDSNLRLKFSPSNPSYHPVVVSAAARDTSSLVSGLAPGSMIRCTDCHNNDEGPRARGGGPNGPHGSNYDFLLERNYTVRDDTVESAFEYALCYKCHQRTSILSDRGFSLHHRHIMEERTPCSACHDPHGINRTQGFGSDHTHLINFDTRIVRPDAVARRMGFSDRGARSGSCTLLCHGSAHRDRAYGPQGAE